MDLLDTTAVTAEQKFMLMLDERLREVEEKYDALYIKLYGVQNTKQIPASVQPFVDKYKQLYESGHAHVEGHVREKEQKRQGILQKVPGHISKYVTLDDTVVGMWSSILTLLSLSPYDRHLYYCIWKLFEDLGDTATPELATWIDNEVAAAQLKS